LRIGRNKRGKKKKKTQEKGQEREGKAIDQKGGDRATVGR